MADVRTHHYRFVYRALSGMALDFGPKMVEEPPPHGVDGSLAALWRHVGESLPAAERLPSDGLSGRILDHAGHRVLLVTLPAPVATAEAYFAAVVRPQGADACRFFILEHSVSPIDGRPGTVLGEWTAKGHLNLGGGPAPEAGRFLEAIEQLLEVRRIRQG